MVQITKTSDATFQYANMLIFGESGSGKTHFLGTVDPKDMLIINITSESGLLTLRGKEIDVINVSNKVDMENTLKWLETEGHKKYKYVSIDSFSQFQKNLEKQSVQSGFKLWSEIKELTKVVVDRMKKMPIHFIAICEVSLKEDDGLMKFVPSLVGSSKDDIAYWFDEVYFFEKVGKAGDAPTYRALTNSGSKYPCKSRIGTLPVVVENPNLETVVNELSPAMQEQNVIADKAEFEIIKNLMTAKKVELESVLKSYKVDKLESLTIQQREDCIKKLNLKE